MSIVSISFSKIEAEKSKPTQGKVNVANNVGIKKLEKASLQMGNTKQDSLKFSFEFSSKTEPSIGSILIEGDVIFVAEKQVVEDAVKAWDDKKPIDQELLTPVLNGILKRCNVEALVLSQTMNLPSPIKLPTVSAKEAKETTSQTTSSE
ncbi:MAG: hypothetical protein ACOCUR_01980 [Nanoarchaeota archaeon]